MHRGRPRLRRRLLRLPRPPASWRGRLPELPGDHRCQGAQPLLEHGDVGCVGALLGCVHRGRPARTEQRVLDVTGDDQFGRTHARVETSQGDGGEVAKSSTAGAHVLPPTVQEAHPERLRHPDAAVARRTTADTDDEAPRTPPQGGPDQFAGPEGRGPQRCDPSVRQPPQPRRLRQFDDGSLSPECVAGHDRLPGRPGDHRRDALEPGHHRGVDSAVTAVGHRGQQHPEARPGQAQAGGYRAGRRARGQASLELVGGDQDTHGSSLTCRSRRHHPARLLRGNSGRHPRIERADGAASDLGRVGVPDLLVEDLHLDVAGVSGSGERRG